MDRDGNFLCFLSSIPSALANFIGTFVFIFILVDFLLVSILLATSKLYACIFLTSFVPRILLTSIFSMSRFVVHNYPIFYRTRRRSTGEVK